MISVKVAYKVALKRLYTRHKVPLFKSFIDFICLLSVVKSKLGHLFPNCFHHPSPHHHAFDKHPESWGIESTYLLLQYIIVESQICGASCKRVWPVWSCDGVVTQTGLALWVVRLNLSCRSGNRSDWNVGAGMGSKRDGVQPADFTICLKEKSKCCP